MSLNGGNRKKKIRWQLAFFDVLSFIFVSILIFVVYPSAYGTIKSWFGVAYIVLGLVFLIAVRMLLGIYGFIWRYAGPKEYTWLMLASAITLPVFMIVRRFVPAGITFLRVISLFALDLLLVILMRQMYQYLYQMRGAHNRLERAALVGLRLLTGVTFQEESAPNKDSRIKVAIIGAGSIGVMLAEELQRNPKAVYYPACFVDVNQEKVGRSINGIPVLDGAKPERDALAKLNVQEVVFALPNVTAERKKELYDLYTGMGYKVKAYDYPELDDQENGRRHLREFQIEELLFRRTADFIDEKTAQWYSGKRIMITGGGGSIGGELARQIARLAPERLVLVDIYENGVYDIEQELRSLYGNQLTLRVEIADVTNREEMEKIISHHKPYIVLHAAAHKHVPLMERNCIEAVRNNVFGTLTVVEACEKFDVARFIMISTDKAVNPTNVMGATKRMCEMIVQSRKGTNTSFSATRFGNVLGSNGSVIPLFRRQIAKGGPVTITDKRIIRYFMTIPEASQLVMMSGAMAKNGELYVLDMGKPVKILELAESMIRLSGLEPYKDINIVETGLRPGEKLYEELLIKTEELDKTDNNLIFVERDKPLSSKEIENKLDILREAMKTGKNSEVRYALKQVVPTYKDPEVVNKKAIDAEEVKAANQRSVSA